MFMLRIVLAGVVGGIVFFMWGFLVHMVVHLHENTFRPLPNEPVMAAQFHGQIPESGAYYFPGLERHRDMTEAEQTAAWESWEERHRAGPIGVLFISKQGREPMEPKVLITGLSIFMLLSLVASMLAGLAGTSLTGFVSRWFFFMGVGLVAVLFGDMSPWNWFGLPNDYAIMMAADHLIAWGLAAIAMAAIVKPMAKPA